MGGTTERPSLAIKSIAARQFAGYRVLQWPGIQRDANLLVGENGVGKSTLLQLIGFALEFLGGRRTEDVFARSHESAEFQIEFYGAEPTEWLRIGSIHTAQGNIRRRYLVRVLQLVENRQPKNTMGLGRNKLQNHATDRYPNTCSELKFLFRRNEDPDLVRRVFELCRRIPVAQETSWEWIEAEVQSRGTKRARPMSCGQFDVAALCLDLLRLQGELQRSPATVFVLLDNPDSYLHPACQEPMLGLIRDVLEHFHPQFFVATHSLRLLCGRDPKTVFWLDRGQQIDDGSVSVAALRDLPEGAKRIFFRLYGDDVSSAVLRLLTEVQQPAYYEFLRECALPATVVSRESPVTDRQMQALRQELKAYKKEWVVLDFGAGSGDLLEALRLADATGLATTYIACDSHLDPVVRRRIEEAREAGQIAPGSRAVARLDEVTEQCDAIMLCNCCHEIEFPDLPRLLAAFLFKYLAKRPGRKLVIHEMEALGTGESRFVMWTPQDYARIFSGIAAVEVQAREYPRGSGVPLHTTIVAWQGDEAVQLPPDLDERLTAAFRDHLPAKREACLMQLDDILPRDGSISCSEELTEAMRQRRVAFLTAQIANIGLWERRFRPARPTPSD